MRYAATPFQAPDIRFSNSELSKGFRSTALTWRFALVLDAIG